MTRIVTTALAASLALGLAACGSDSGDGSGSGPDDKSVTLVTHDSFAASDDVLKAFEKESGYKVDILKGKDAGSAVNQAVLSKDNPQGDVFFGIDNTLLSRGLDNGIFTPYEAGGLDRVPKELQLDAGEHRVTPVDYGDVCVNYDVAYFEEKNLDPPQTLDDLADPRYRDLLVTENAATSSPGLAFLLATADEYGDGGTAQGEASGGGWEDYWSRLRDNGVEVVDGWEQAYYERFSGAGKGDKPLVVSYASSPPVLDMESRPEEATTGVATGTCFRQIEFAGLLAGAGNTEGGKALIDFLIGERFQKDMPLQMFVHPARENTELPEVFTRYGEEIADPHTLDPAAIDDNREQWIKTWTSLVVK